MNKKDYKDIINSLILCFIVLFFIFALMIILYTIIDAFTNENDNWISFWGSIIGGAMTLFGVWWTIKSTQNDLIDQMNLSNIQLKKQLSAQYRPFLEMKDKVKIDSIEKKNASNNYKLKSKNMHSGILDISCNNFAYCINIEIFIKNLGDGEAYVHQIGECFVNLNHYKAFDKNIFDYKYNNMLEKNKIKDAFNFTIPRREERGILLRIFCQNNSTGEEIVKIKIPFYYIDQFGNSIYDAEVNLIFKLRYNGAKPSVNIMSYSINNNEILDEKAHKLIYRIITRANISNKEML